MMDYLQLILTLKISIILYVSVTTIVAFIYGARLILRFKNDVEYRESFKSTIEILLFSSFIYCFLTMLTLYTAAN